MRYAQGGTQTYCPHCKKITVCKAVSPSELGEDSHRHYCKNQHIDVNWARRFRLCLTCDENFVTAEINERFVDELVELRDALAAIKLNAEAYIRQSTSASNSLKKLSKSLDVLRALSIYKET